MERRKLFPMATLALCLTIALSVQPAMAQSYSEAYGEYQLKLSGYGVIMDMQTGKIAGWNARLTGTVEGYFEAYERYGEVGDIHFSVDYVNLYFSWTRSPFGFGKMSDQFYASPLMPMSSCNYLNPPLPLADSMTWKVNFDIDMGPLQAPVSFTVRWYGPYAPGRMGTISGMYKGPIPLGDSPLVFIPIGSFSYGVRLSGAATIYEIGSDG